MQAITLFLQFAGFVPFINLAVNDGVTLTLRVLSPLPTQNTVKVLGRPDVSSLTQNDNIGRVFIGNNGDFATFQVTITEPVELLELNVSSASLLQTKRVFIPVALFSDPRKTEHPGPHVFPTEDGESAVKIDVLSSFALPVSPYYTSLTGPKMTPSFDYYYNKAKNLVFGHRGMGISYKFFNFDAEGKPIIWNKYVENTIESLNAVAELGGDGVEFDVIITKDFVPILFHDFHVCIKAETPQGASPRFIKIGLHELTFAEIRGLQLYHTAVFTAINKYPQMPLELFRLRNDIAFPTLEDVVTKADPRLAFNLEVKYPQVNIYNQDPCPGYHSRTVVADRIISVLAKHLGNRPLTFTVFDLDFCHLVSTKQQLWPVGALTAGKIVYWPKPLDIRSRATATTAQFAKDINIWGISAQSLEFQADPSLLAHVRKTIGVGVMIWGDNLADPLKAAALMPRDTDVAANMIITDNTAGVVKECKA